MIDVARDKFITLSWADLAIKNHPALFDQIIYRRVGDDDTRLRLLNDVAVREKYQATGQDESYKRVSEQRGNTNLHGFFSMGAGSCRTPHSTPSGGPTGHHPRCLD